MPYSEFIHHIAFHQLFPWGEDWKQAEAISASVMSASTKYKWFDIRRFFPKPKTPKPQSPDHIFGFFKQMALDAEAQRKAKSGG